MTRLFFCFRRARREQGVGSAPDLNEPSRYCRTDGFTLLEVVVALGVFVAGVIAVIALLAPVAKLVASVSEVESASHVADGLLVRLQTLPFESAARLLQDQPAVLEHDALQFQNLPVVFNPAVIFARLNGEAGIYDGAENGWVDSTGSEVADAAKFFQIDLIRHPILSPSGTDAVASMLAFTIRVRWPRWLPTAGGAGLPSRTGVHPQQQTLFFAGSLRR